jgi:hypothetical protein
MCDPCWAIKCVELQAAIDFHAVLTEAIKRGEKLPDFAPPALTNLRISAEKIRQNPHFMTQKILMKYAEMDVKIKIQIEKNDALRIQKPLAQKKTWSSKLKSLMKKSRTNSAFYSKN